MALNPFHKHSHPGLHRSPVALTNRTALSALLCRLPAPEYIATTPDAPTAGAGRPMSPTYAIAARQAKERALEGSGAPQVRMGDRLI